MRICLAILILFTSMVLNAAQLNQIVAFGDSLSDNGNLFEYMKHQLPVCPPYFQGRFTNGPVWVELLTESYYGSSSNDHLLDYAFGGAGVLEDDDGGDDLFTLKKEVDSYLLAHNDKANPNALHVIWIGSNNYLGMPDEPSRAIKSVTQGIQNELERLVSKGAKYFLL